MKISVLEIAKTKLRQAYRLASAYATPRNFDATERVNFYADAVLNVPLGSALAQQSVSGILKYADDLPDVEERVEAYKNAAAFSSLDSAPVRQAVIGLLKNADDLPDATARVEAYRFAAYRSGPSPDTALAQRAMAGMFKHSDGLPDAAARVEAYSFVAEYASPGSDLEKQAKQKLKELQSTTQPQISKPAAAQL
ncbi:hypothetical protein [Methylocapsa aurea]|uniref:hypothetical protein n=1 Tax=Methylocapsa aurea TaxID=663610 RepID=UPI00056985B6|nr:hypothetical protein [Methylocapsa aurea]